MVKRIQATPLLATVPTSTLSSQQSTNSLTKSEATMIPNSHFHDLDGTTNYVDLETNQAHIPFPYVDSRVANMLLGIRFPTDLLPIVLHEGTHHHTFMTPVGTALAVLASNVRIQTAKAAVAKQEIDDKVACAYLRYKAAINLFGPLIEGLALFAEHDLIRGGDVTNFLYTQISVLCAGKLNTGDVGNEELDEQFNRRARTSRLNLSGIKRKEKLLVQSLDTNVGRGYLAGYLLVKNLRQVIISKTTTYIDSEALLELILSVFFRDFEIAEHLISDPLLPGIRGCELWINDLASMYQEKFAYFTTITKKGLELALWTLAGNDKRRFVRGHPQVFSDMGKAESSARSLERYIETVYSENSIYSDFENEIMSRRNILRVGICRIRIRVKDERVFLFNGKEGDFAYSSIMPAISGACPDDGIGEVEFFCGVAESDKPIWGATVTLNGNIVGVSTRSRIFSGKEFIDLVNGRTGNSLQSYQLAQEAYLEKSEKINSANAQDFIKSISIGINEIYAQRSIGAGLRDVSMVRRLMDAQGFAALMDNGSALDKRKRVFALAALTICTSLSVKLSVLADELAAQEVTDDTISAVFETLRKYNFYGTSKQDLWIWCA
jgi:hypothetical protein